MCNLLSLFRQDTALLHERGAFIIRCHRSSDCKRQFAIDFRQLCVLLRAERVYSTLAVLLSDENDMHFAALIVRTLSTILLTSTELYTLRRALSPLPENDVNSNNVSYTLNGQSSRSQSYACLRVFIVAGAIIQLLSLPYVYWRAHTITHSNWSRTAEHWTSQSTSLLKSTS